MSVYNFQMKSEIRIMVEKSEKFYTTAPQVLIVEDHPLVASFFVDLMTDLYPACKTYTANSNRGAISIIKAHQFALIVLDINLLDGISISWIDMIKRMQPDVRILMVSTLPEETFGLRTLQLGADGYINKTASVATITDAIKTIMAGQKFISPSLLDTLLKESVPGAKKPDNPFDLLSSREFEIAVLLVNGDTAVTISNMLGLQRSTVSTHKMQILKKLNVENVIELNTLAIQHKIKGKLNNTG